MNWFTHGGFKKNVFIDIRGVSLSRPLLEHLVRERVLSVPNISLLDNTAAKALLYNVGTKSVSGVTAKNRGDSTTTNYSADLVVDCTGRGSQTAGWLKWRAGS